MKKNLIYSVIAFLSVQLGAQVSDVSVTLQPTLSYNWWDSNAAIQDGVMVGGRLGFGFGESIELRGVYEKSIDAKNTASKIDFLSQEAINSFKSRNVDVERIGGEFKANIPTGGSFAPYLTVGSGVQKLKVRNNAKEEALKSEQIYANLGLGFKVNLGDRITLNIEGKNTVFNLNPSNVLFLDVDDNSDFQQWINNKDNTRMYNWSVLAGLQIYLGGRKPGELSRLDRAYLRKFSGGLSGFKLIVEPGIAYMNFDAATSLRDTYLVGGQAGFDFNQYIGLRGFYYQSTQNDKLSFDWDKLSIYGGDLVAKLNVARGLIPYITLGGGYMNVYDKYQGKENSEFDTSSGYFAKGGLGLNIPVTKNVELFGAASLVYTTDKEDYSKLSSPDQLRQHTMYNAGLRFQLGKNANEDVILDKEIDDRVNERTAIYESRISELESELKSAYATNDTDKVIQIIQEKKELEQFKNDEIAAAVSTTQVSEPKKDCKSGKSKDDCKTRFNKKGAESNIRMTPKELENLVEKVLEGVDKEENAIHTTEDRIDRLERLLLEVNTGAGVQSQEFKSSLANEKIISALQKLDEKIDNNSNQIANMNAAPVAQDKTVVIQGATSDPNVVTTLNKGQVVGDKKEDVKESEATINTTTSTNKGVVSSWLIYEGLSVLGGVGIGEDAASIVGIRGHYSLTDSNIGFLPELYVSPGSTTGFGLNANAIYTLNNIETKAILKPYIGVGVGYNNIGGIDKFGGNIMVGTSFNILNGNLYADYTARGFVDLHQIVVGYKFGF